MSFTYATALVVGKFYPPHAGHHALIEAACREAARVWVFVCHTREQTIPGWLRAVWLRRAHPEATICEIDDTLADDIDAWAKFSVEYLGFVPSVVFSSEAYGTPFAEALGSAHRAFDVERRTYDVSGTRVRENPHAYRSFLKPYVYAWYVPRVCLVGAESTGKTTLARALANVRGGTFVEEYAREYCEAKFAGTGGPNAPLAPPTWRREEFLAIATEHARREDSATQNQSSLLVVDTDAFATCLWYERYWGELSSELEAFAETRKSLYTLYVLCGDEIPWVEDSIRDGKEIRSAMHVRFRQRLVETRRPWIEARGSVSERLETVVRALEKIPRTKR